jgi:Anti-sigma-K factor rskA, C-terminal
MAVVMTGGDPSDPAVARLLEDPAVWTEVSPDLRARTLAEATAAGRARPDQRPTRFGGHRLLLAAAVLLVALMVAGGLRLVLASDPEARGVEVALSGTDELPGASATAKLTDEPAGVSVLLDVAGIPPAPDGSFYEVWLVGDSGKVSAGTFHRRGDEDEISLWLGVDPAAYDAITVTRQPIAGGTTAEGVVVLRGELPGATQAP